MSLNCIVVDDSSIQRLSLIKLIESNSNLNLIAEYKNAVDAKNGIGAKKIDLIFLDVEMPVINGFEFLDVLTNKPQIIFVTGKAEYAMRAFEYEATDYLKKPIEKERFNIAVEKALQKHLLNKDQNVKEGEYIFIKSNLKKRKVFIDDIKWIEALGDYVKVFTIDNNYVVLSTMNSELMKKIKELPEKQFLRVHKSYIVNLKKIERFDSKHIEIAGMNIPLSRTKKTILAEALEQFS